MVSVTTSHGLPIASAMSGVFTEPPAGGPLPVTCAHRYAATTFNVVSPGTHSLPTHACTGHGDTGEGETFPMSSQALPKGL
jgi:hypothetical protein